MGFHITCDDYGQWRWVLEDDQTEIAVSATSYATEQECARAISMVMATTYRYLGAIRAQGVFRYQQRISSTLGADTYTLWGRGKGCGG